MGEDLILEEGETYVFKDDKCKETYLKRHTKNRTFFEWHYEQGFTLGEVDEDGDGIIGSAVVIDSLEEKHLFKKKDTCTPTYWNGEEDLQVGMIVGRNCAGKIEFKVEYIGQEYCIVTEVATKEEHSVQIKNLMTLKKFEKEETFDKVLDAWNRKSIDFAHDSNRSVVVLEDLFDVMYSVMKESD